MNHNSTFVWVQCCWNYKGTLRNWTLTQSRFVLAIQPIHNHSSWKPWLHQAWSNCGNKVSTVNPVAIPEVVTRLLKILSKQRRIKLNMSRADRKQDAFSWTTPWLLSATKPFENIQTGVLPTATLICSRQAQDVQQNLSAKATAELSPAVMCRALWRLFVQPEQRRHFGGFRPYMKLAYLVVEACNLLLTGRGKQERVHLGLQGVVHLHIYIVARRLLLVIGIHAEIQKDF